MKKLQLYKKLKDIILADNIVLVGSSVLFMQGLIDTEPVDLDVVIVNPNKSSMNVIKHLHKTSPKDIKNSISFDPESTDGTIRYAFLLDGVKVDAFIVKEYKSKTITLEGGITMNTVQEVIDYKRKYSRPKDALVLSKISHGIFNIGDIPMYLEKYNNTKNSNKIKVDLPF